MKEISGKSAQESKVSKCEKKGKKPKPSKAEKTKKEKELLLGKLAANNLKDIRSKVAFILNHYPVTRNTDIKLAFKYWQIFQPEYLHSDGSVDQSKMFKLERMPSLIRARAKIQNEFGLFQADEEVKAKRRTLKFKEKEEQLADKPSVPGIAFYVDESGKNQRYIIVGGMCSANFFRTFQLQGHLMKWMSTKKVSEFHFTKLSKHKLQVYKDFFTEALGFSDTISFKAVAIKQEGIKRSVEDIVCNLHYQLIHKGIEHEVRTGRATLPRVVTIYKDKDDGTDRILMVKFEQDLKLGFKQHFDDQLELDILEAVDSKNNLFIQLSDLYIGSLSRILNRDSESQRNHKDELADYIVSLLGLDLNGENAAYQDVAFIDFL